MSTRAPIPLNFILVSACLALPIGFIVILILAILP